MSAVHRLLRRVRGAASTSWLCCTLIAGFSIAYYLSFYNYSLNLTDEGFLVNGALRVLDIERRTVADLGEAGFAGAGAPLAEPAGIAVGGPGRLLVADTNNHRIVEVDVAAAAMRAWAD